MKLSHIKGRKIINGLEIINEVIKPVAEKWVDGEVRETDNLQLTIQSVCNKTITDVMAYLYYYDMRGKELGHEFDIPESKILSGEKARLSFLLLPPENFSYADIEIKGKIEKKRNYVLEIILGLIFIVAVYGYKYFSDA